MKKIIISAVACALLSGSAYAGGKGVILTDVIVVDIPEVEKVYDDSFYTLGLKVGTLGVGIDASMALTHNFSIRGNINGFYYKTNLNDIIGSNVAEFQAYGGNADGELTLLTVGLLVDYFPFDESDFRLSAGVYYNGNELAITGDTSNSTDTITLGTSVFNINDMGTVSGNTVFDKVAPYIGIGWGNRNDEPGWSWSLDIGALYQNVPQIDANVKLSAASIAAGGVLNTTTGVLVNQASVDADVATEVTNANNDIKNSEFADYTKFYPVVMFGITYSF
ncbi:MAG: hypothetical protein QM493_03520 [Sulfurovum sp.]